MCRRHKTAQFQDSNNEIFGILFNGTWLWEEYLCTILKDSNFKHAKNKEGKGGIYLFRDRTAEEKIEDQTYYRRYPDFYRNDNNPSKDWILDAKYKHLEDIKIARDDMHQIIAYMHVQEANNGGLIYPLAKADADANSKIQETTISILRGHGGKISTYGVIIPQQKEDFQIFREFMQEAEGD